jgi:hypothetical protein
LAKIIKGALAFGLSALSAIGCVPQEEDGDDVAFQRAIPLAQSLSINVPNAQGSGTLAVGDKSALYEITRAVSLNVNAHVAVALAYPAIISLYPPTTRGDGFRVWGPSEPRGLERVSWRMRIDQASPTEFTYRLEGRPKGSADEAAFLPVMTGTVTPGADRLKSKGTMTLLFDNSYALEADLCRKGAADIAWDAQGSSRTVDVTWRNFENICRGEEERIDDATYRYTEAADQSGTFSFSAFKDIHEAAEGKPLPETMTMTSRWTTSGRGRSDVVITGGEVTQDLASFQLPDASVQATQCWSDLFVLTYADTSPDALEAAIFPNIGDLSDCPFPEAAP